MDIERNKFKAWLESKVNPNYIVGRSSDGCLCPIATFLNETVGVAKACSFEVHATTFGSLGSVNILPDWAKSFVFRADNGTIHRSITAEEALEILGGIT